MLQRFMQQRAMRFQMTANEVFFHGHEAVAIRHQN
jgi:hypothetical protein